jgi:hypothetical protein
LLSKIQALPVDRRKFTLLELLICIMIISLVGGVLALPLKDMLERHRLHHNVKTVFIQFKKAQALALNYQSDMGLRFYEDEGIFCCDGFTDEPIRPFKLLKLQGISNLDFNGIKISAKPLEFKVFASGRIEPTGKLIFHKGADFLEIDLTTPLQISIVKPKENKDEIDESSI